MEAIKTCKDCGQTKSREDFYRRPHKSPGCRDSVCRPCRGVRLREKSHARRAAEGKPVRPFRRGVTEEQRRLELWEKNGIDPNTREFRDGRWRIKAEFKKSYKAFKAYGAYQHLNENGRKVKYADPVERANRMRFSCSKTQARTNDKEFTLSFEEFVSITSLPCHYCDKPVIQKRGGLDRIDNRFGYIPGNVLSAHGSCNQIRGHNLTVEEARAAVQSVMKVRETYALQIKERQSVKSN